MENFPFLSRAGEASILVLMPESTLSDNAERERKQRLRYKILHVLCHSSLTQNVT